MRLMQDFVLNNVQHLAYEAQHLHQCVTNVLIVDYMVKKPSTVDEAIAYVWDVPDTVIGPADKQSLLLHWLTKQMLLLGGTFLPRALGGHLERAAQTNRYFFTDTVRLWLQLQMWACY